MPVILEPSCYCGGIGHKIAEQVRSAGEKADSPTIPARIATAFRPICTTVKNIPVLPANRGAHGRHWYYLRQSHDFEFDTPRGGHLIFQDNERMR